VVAGQESRCRSAVRDRRRHGKTRPAFSGAGKSCALGGRSLPERNFGGRPRGGRGVVPAVSDDGDDADRDQGDARRRRDRTQSDDAGSRTKLLLTPCIPGTCGRYPRLDFYVATVGSFSRS
jgi:hypothetical protein